MAMEKGDRVVTEEPSSTNAVGAPGVLELVFTKDGVEYEFSVIDPIQGAATRMKRRLTPQEVSEKLQGPFTLLQSRTELDERTGELLRVRLWVRFTNPNWRRWTSALSAPEIPRFGPGDMGDAAAYLAASIKGEARPGATHGVPGWRLPFIERARSGRGNTLVDAIRGVLRQRGSATLGELKRELEKLGYRTSAGSFYASVSVLRDDFGEIRQTGRGDLARLEWRFGPNVAPAIVPAHPSPDPEPGSSDSFGPALVYTKQTIRGFRYRGKEVPVRTYKDMLLWVGRTLVEEDPSNVAKLSALHGTRRRYFSKSEGDITAVPARVPGTDLFVETNLSADFLVKVCRLALEATGHKRDDLEVLTGGT